MVEFKNSETRINLMRAFAGESQARNRYTIAAQKAKEKNLQIIHDVFIYTANQEKEHAEVFYDYLKQMTGEKVTISGDYPVDNYDDIDRLLRAAQHGETDEYENVYKNFAETAKKEGYTAIAASFELIAQVENVHAKRFGKFAEMVEQNTLFTDKNEVVWMCQNCGHIHTANSAPGRCPLCNVAQGWFLRNDMTPYSFCAQCENNN